MEFLDRSGTVRGDRVSIAVIRPGHVEDEAIVTENTFLRSRALAAGVFPTKIRVPRGGKPAAPGKMTLTARNPFDQEFQGKAVFTIPQGSTWSMSPKSVEVTLAPGQQKQLVYSLNCEGPIVPEKLPRYSLAGTVGKRTLWPAGFRTWTDQRIEFDFWPYHEMRRTIDRTGLKWRMIQAGLSIAETMKIGVLNPLDEAAAVHVRWKTTPNSNWKVSPGTATVNLAAGQREQIPFEISFSGTRGQMMNVPAIYVRYVAGGDDAHTIARSLVLKDIHKVR